MSPARPWPRPGVRFDITDEAMPAALGHHPVRPETAGEVLTAAVESTTTACGVLRSAEYSPTEILGAKTAEATKTATPRHEPRFSALGLSAPIRSLMRGI